MNGEHEVKETPQDLVTETEQVSEDVRGRLKLKTIGVDAVSLFCRQLSTLVDVGIPLLKCLQILHQRTSHPKLQAIIHSLSNEIEQGSAFSVALEKFPHVFSPFFINMTKVAEKGGNLDESLKVVADVMEKEELMKQKVRDALIYPLTTLLVGLFVVGVLLIVVIPMFGDLYSQQNFDLPWPTRVLLALGDPKIFWIWLLLIVGAVLFIVAYAKSPESKAFFDRYKLKLPVFGPLFTKLYVSRFSRNFGTLIRGGVPMLQSLDVVKETSENMVVEEAVEKITQHVERGGRLEQPLREADIFPDVVVDMIAIGEEAGKLDLMLFKVADLYDGEIDRSINTLASSLQPILIVIMGFLTAFVATAMFWPYFRMAKILGAGF
ncbi:type IV pilus assembly protein PilC [Candidatus Vecturithrix granuli]|uniref:Type IV pilus assembly protein PilC n=1 Tax=Vecturithrix granuli TaxID=1499967 RepID=A0A0S6W9Y0_VECG1|nr:type IV pilus assembly protein PilC [Candidatus Vecturithrix granuli]